MLILKKYKYLFIVILLIYIPIISICFIPSGYSIIAVGDISNVNTLIEVDTDYEQSGSFNSIWVSSYDESTIIQKLFAQLSNANDIIKNEENSTAGQVVKTQSDGSLTHDYGVEQAIITAYDYADNSDSSINLVYDFRGLIVYYIKGNTVQLKLGDIITSYNNININSSNAYDFYNGLYLESSISSLTILRNSQEITFNIDRDISFSFAAYPKYNIDYSASNPKLKVNNSFTEGPSAGFMNTLSTFEALTSYDYSSGLKIAGTGTINFNGEVGAIGGIKQKVIAAFDNKCDVFFCPADNYDDGYRAYLYLKNKERMDFVKVENFSDAITYLTNV